MYATFVAESILLYRSIGIDFFIIFWGLDSQPWLILVMF